VLTHDLLNDVLEVAENHTGRHLALFAISFLLAISFGATPVSLRAAIDGGEDPRGVVREPGRNEPCIEIARERVFEYQGQGFLPVSNPDFPFAVRRRIFPAP